MKKEDANILISAYCSVDKLGRPYNRIKEIEIDDGTLEIIPETPLYGRFCDGRLQPTYWRVIENTGKDSFIHDQRFSFYSAAVVYMLKISVHHSILGVKVVRRDY